MTRLGAQSSAWPRVSLRAARVVLWALVTMMVAIWLYASGGFDALTRQLSPPSPTIGADVGLVAPPIKLPLAGGGDTDLAAYRGRVVLVNFWATWCIPCRTEMPAIDRAYQANRDRGLDVLAIDVQEREADVLSFLRDVGVSFPSAIDTTGEVVRRYRATALPSSFVVDRQGTIRVVHVGPLTEEMLEREIIPLLDR